MLFRLLKQTLLGGKGDVIGPFVLQAGIRAYEAGDFLAASDHLAAVLRANPNHAEAHFYAGLAATNRNRHDEALEHFERACALDQGRSDYYYHAGVAHRRLGNNDAALKCCQAALALATDPPFAYYELMARSSLPGPFYFDLLRQIHEFLRPRTYLEIGVENGESIALALPETRVIGIDPAPNVQFRLSANTTIHALTSDEYFATHDVHAEFSGLPIDLAFIDGMHKFEFALRDFVNIEKRCAHGSTILIHDCYPLDRDTAERGRCRRFWSGDIWRLVLALRKYRPDLQFHTVATAPTGLGVVRSLDPTSRVLEHRIDAIVREFLGLDYSVLDADKPGMLALYPNDWNRVKEILQ